MKLLRAVESDIQEILDIHNSLFEYKYTFDNYLTELSLDIADFMVLKNDDKIIGYFVVHSVFEQMEIVIIALQMDYQGLGYGNFLLEYIEYLRVKNNCEYIMIEVLESNYHAIYFYEKHHFKLISQRNDYYAKGSHALIYRR